MLWETTYKGASCMELAPEGMKRHSVMGKDRLPRALCVTFVNMLVVATYHYDQGNFSDCSRHLERE